jgi:hypothetical protein
MKIMADKEVTVREGTIITLEQSTKGFEALKDAFNRVGEAVDSKDYIKALNIIAEEVIPPTNGLYSFFITIADTFDLVLGEELTKKLLIKIKVIDEVIDSLEDETTNNDIVEIADLLRYDYYDALTDLELLIPAIIEKFKKSDAPELDKL